MFVLKIFRVATKIPFLRADERGRDQRDWKGEILESLHILIFRFSVENEKPFESSRGFLLMCEEGFVLTHAEFLFSMICLLDSLFLEFEF